MNFGSRQSGFFSGGATGGGGGGVSSVTGTAPISSSGGATPNISISQSSGSTNGFLSSTDWTTFNNKVGGSGTTNFIPKFSNTGTPAVLADGLMFDNGTSVGLGTITPSASFKFDVVGSIRASAFGYFGSDQVRINTSTSGYVDLYSSAERKMLIGDGATDVASFRAYNGNIFQFDNNNDFIPTELVRFSSQITKSAGANTHNVVQSSPILALTGGTTTVRGFYYNPTLTASTGLTNIAFQNVSGDIIFGNLKDNVNLTTQVAMLDLDGKVVRQSSLTKFQLFQSGATAVGIDIDFAAPTYVFGNDISARAALRITTDEWSARYAAVNQGLLLDFGNVAYTFGQIDDGISLLDLFHKVDGTANSELAYFQFQSNRIGYEFDFSAKTFKFGDFNGAYGDGSVQIDVTNSTMLFQNDQTTGSTTFEANSIVLTGTNLEVSAGGGNKRYLKITLNGIDSTIELTDI
jgi:hypothetical protein